jgi:hypothetical protein
MDERGWALSGTVTFEVEVLPGGDVGDVQYGAGDPYLAQLSINEARRWKFVSSKTAWRTKITFVVEPQGETMDDTRVEAHYESPRTLHVQRLQSIVKRWPRVDGKPPEKSCSLHTERMHIEVLPIRYGGIPTGDPDPPLVAEYKRAWQAEFKNAAECVLLGDFIEPEKFAEVYICDACSKARKAWLAAHEGFRPPY